MFIESVNKETKHVLDKIAKDAFIKDFYLAGGTALAIHLGHRESIDLDWFSQKEFSNDRIKEEMASLGKFELNSEEAGTIHGAIDDVKVSFLNYSYGNIFPLQFFEGINLADERDIAAMKIDAISSRGSKKDFIDLFFLLRKYSLEELLDFFEKKFKNIHYNKLHILKSLVYFETAESEPMPRMIQKVGWDEVKAAILKETNGFLRRQV